MMPLLTRILHVHKKEIGMCKFRRPFPLLPLILFIIYAFGVVFKLFATFPSYTIGYRGFAFVYSCCSLTWLSISTNGLF